MANPLTDELPDEAKAELAAIFAQLAVQYPPVTFHRIGVHTAILPIQRYKPWHQGRRGW